MNKKRFFGIAGIVAFILISMIAPPEGLTTESMRCLGIFAWAVCYWVGDVLPFLVTCMGMFCALIFSGAATFAVAVSGFTNSVICFIFGAMGISVALTKSGLMRRISFCIMKLFSPTFKGQVIGLMTAGLIINPLVPSVTAKTAMVMPISKGISDAMGYGPYSKGMYGIWTACFVGITIASYSFFNCNFTSLLAKGMLPEDVQAEFGLVRWFLASLPWLVVIMIGMGAFILICYKPDKVSTAINREYVADELRKLGPLSRDEKICLAVLLTSVMLWAFETRTGLPSHVIAVAAVVILISVNVITVDDFIRGTGWNMIIVISLLMGLSNNFTATGISAWVAGMVKPLVEILSGSNFIILVAIALVVYIMRFAITSQMAAIPIFLNMFFPVCQVTSISPWVICFASLTSNAIWTVLYQTVYGMQGFAAYGGDQWIKYGQLSKAGLFYMVLNIGALGISIPVWTAMGLM